MKTLHKALMWLALFLFNHAIFYCFTGLTLWGRLDAPRAVAVICLHIFIFIYAFVFMMSYLDKHGNSI